MGNSTAKLFSPAYKLSKKAEKKIQNKIENVDTLLLILDEKKKGTLSSNVDGVGEVDRDIALINVYLVILDVWLKSYRNLQYADIGEDYFEAQNLYERVDERVKESEDTFLQIWRKTFNIKTPDVSCR